MSTHTITPPSAVAATSPASRRRFLQLAGIAVSWPLLARGQDRSAPAQLPLRTTGLQHLGMQVSDVEAAGQFYGRLFSPSLTKEPEPPLRYYARLGSDSLAIGGANGRPARIDHYCPLAEGYDASAMAERLQAEGLSIGNQGLVADPDGLRLQLLRARSGPAAPPAESSARPVVRVTDEPAVVTPIALERVMLRVSDLDRALPFYRMFFGRESAREGNRIWFQLADTRLGLELAPSGESPRIDHFCLNVARFDRSAVAAKLVALGGTLAASDEGANELHFKDLDGISVVLRAT